MCCSAPAWAVMRIARRRLAHDVAPALRPGMPCLADRYVFGHALWRAAAAAGADLPWRARSNLRLPRATVLADGSYLSMIYPSEKDRRHAARGVAGARGRRAWWNTGWKAWRTPSRCIGW